MKKFLLSFSSLGMLATTATTVACSTPMYKTNEIRTGIIEGWIYTSSKYEIPFMEQRIFLWHQIYEIWLNDKFLGIDGWYQDYDTWGEHGYYFDYYARVTYWSSGSQRVFYIDSKNLDRIMRT